MTQMTSNDSTNASRRETFNLGDAVSMACVCVDEEMWRFLTLFAASTGLIQLRGRLADYRAAQDQDAFLESVGNLALDICLVDFDKDPHTAVLVAERIHSSLPETMV